MKTTMEIPDVLFREAKRYAAGRGLSLKQVMESALRRTLETAGGPAPPFRLRKHAFGGRGLAVEGGWEPIRERIYKGRGE
jgi:hypothetical protein